MKVGLVGWRRSGDRASLGPNSLQTGNFTGKTPEFLPEVVELAASCRPKSRLAEEIPAPPNREKISPFRERIKWYQGIFNLRRKR